jgi:endonuclease G
MEPADRHYFFLCHDSARRVAAWVGYTLTPDSLVASAARPARFRQDFELAGPAASDRDYRSSGYSRGHLAPAADFAFSDEAIRSTFILSNAIPQRLSVNSGVWARVEAGVRRLAREAERLFIFTGPLFEGDRFVIGPGRVAVPSHTFKAVLILQGGSKRMVAFIVSNQDHVRGPVDASRVSVDEVEHRTGLDFFSELEDSEESRLEAL